MKRLRTWIAKRIFRVWMWVIPSDDNGIDPTTEQRSGRATDDLPSFTYQSDRDLAARNYQRINDPRRSPAQDTRPSYIRHPDLFLSGAMHEERYGWILSDGTAIGIPRPC